MKKNDSIIVISALLFSGLFYQQTAGINCLLFTLLVSIVILVRHPEKLSDASWWYYCGCANLTGLAVFIINSELSILACLASTLVLSSKTLNSKNSVLLSGFFGFFSLVSAPVYWIIELTEQKREGEPSKKQRNWKMLGSIGISIVAIILFFNLYRLSNPLFEHFTAFINFDWLNFGWIAFTFFGFIILRGILRNRQIEDLSRAEITAKRDILKTEGADSETSHRNTTIIAWTLFSALNIMLLFLNSLDITNIYLVKKLPAGITLSDFVHNAVSNTVVSIVIAVSLILLIFKADLNFNKQGKKVKWLVYLWILQSVIVVINTMVRNYRYIQEYQLTYLRIGVFVFLTLCLFGLAFTYYKMAKHKSAWYLAVMNFELWFLLLICSSLINWDKTVTHYNIEHATIKKPLDVHYLLELSAANLPELIALKSTIAFTEADTRMLRYKIRGYYKDNCFRQWQSFSLRSHQNIEAINHIAFNQWVK